MTPLLEALTEREEAVLLLIADDLGLREIAQRLGISPRTVRGHRDSARKKLDVHTTTAAVAIVVRHRAAVG